MKIPVFSLTRATALLQESVAERWKRLTLAGAFVGGAEIETFETAFAAYLGSAGCVGVANGTDALVVAMKALDLAPGDEVIVPAFTFIATATAVVLAGGRPVFADVVPETLNLDPQSVAERITERTVGVIGVHLFGRPFDVQALVTLCEECGLWLVEDAAQAQGAAAEGRRVGNFGRLTTWSFYPTKNLGAFGDGGAISGNDLELLARVRSIANHGRKEHYFHGEVGVNSRLDGLQAAVLNERLVHLEESNDRRREIACRYSGAISGAPSEQGVEGLLDEAGYHCVYHQFTLRAPDREALKEALASEGIGSGVYYPIPLHQQPALAEFADPNQPLPVSEEACRSVLSLPMFPELTDSEVETVGQVLKRFYGA